MCARARTIGGGADRQLVLVDAGHGESEGVEHGLELGKLVQRARKVKFKVLCGALVTEADALRLAGEGA